jgi:SAM-dependent methyltransferase
MRTGLRMPARRFGRTMPVMSRAVSDDAVYILGQSESERRRLDDQGEFLRGFTASAFDEAGLAAGMRVLDVGCGTGDVSRIVAALVGSGGSVVGVDRDVETIDDARERATADGLTNALFVCGDLRELELGGQFDAIVGRFVLMYLADPAAALAHLQTFVRPGGVIVFQEWMADDAFLSAAHCPEWHRVTDLVVEAFRHAGTRLDMGLGLHGAFVDAGLPAPTLRAERPVGGGEHYGGYEYIVGVLRSIMPAIEGFGIARADDLDLDNLASRLCHEAVTRRAAIALPTLVTAWARRPSHGSSHE